MRPQGQLKIDAALPDSNDKPGARLTDPQGGWGDANLRPPGASRGLKKRADSVPLPLGAPPPPAGVGMEEEADPVAGLFANDRIVPAPGINDSPNEAEIGRWVATAHTSLFDDRVKDPAPGGLGAAANDANDELRPSTLEMIDQHLDQPAIPGMTEPLLAPPRKARAAVPAQAAAPAPEAAAAAAPAPAAKARTGSASGARKRAALAAAAAPAASEPEPSAQSEDASELKARKRRIERGPSKAMLAGLGAATFIALGVAAVLLGMLPNPLAPSAAPAVPAPQQARGALPAHAKPVAQKPAGAPASAPASKPAAAPSPTAVAKPPAAAAKAKSAAPAPAVVAPVVAAPAATVARSSAPQARVAAPVPAAAMPVRAEPADSDGDASEAGGASGKLAQARKLLSAENPEGAEALARQVLAGDPQDHHAMDVLARALMDQDRGAEALPIARKMVQRRGKRVQYRLLLGDLQLMVGNAAEARAEWQDALELAPNDREIKRRLGN